MRVQQKVVAGLAILMSTGIACLAGDEKADAKSVVVTNHPVDAFSAPRAVMVSFYKAVTNNAYEAYRTCLHPESRKVDEYGSEEAMRFWRKQFDDMKKKGFDGVWHFEEVPATLATEREPAGAVKAYPVVGEKPSREYCLLMKIEGEWKIVRLFS
jgi:hypothetical protein